MRSLQTVRLPLAVVVAALVAVAAASTLLSSSAAFAARRVDIAVKDDTYNDGDPEPGTTRIQVGDTVTWRWGPGNLHLHTVTSVEPGLFDSDTPCPNNDRRPCRGPGRIYEATFQKAGSYRYFCKVHPLGMRGVVEVVAPPLQPAPPEQPRPAPSPGGPVVPPTIVNPSQPPSPPPPDSPPPAPQPPPQGPQPGPAPGPGQPTAQPPQGGAPGGPLGGAPGGGTQPGGPATRPPGQAGPPSARPSSQPAPTDDGDEMGMDEVESQPADDGRPATVRVRSRLAQPYPIRIEKSTRSGSSTDDPEVAGPDASGRTSGQGTRLPRTDSLPGLPDAAGGQVPDELAFDVPKPPADRSRALLTGVAVLALLGSAGALGKFVLFAPPWS